MSQNINTVAMKKAIKDIVEQCPPEALLNQVNGVVLIGVNVIIKENMVHPQLHLITKLPKDVILLTLKDLIGRLENEAGLLNGTEMKGSA